MADKILVAGNGRADAVFFESHLGPRGFDIDIISATDSVADLVAQDPYDAILVDYDCFGGQVFDWVKHFQENRSRTCFILYGEQSRADEISDILQAGAYGYVPRAFLDERIYDTLVDGLENRRAFIRILGMVDELRDINERLELEKSALKAKNQELGFINRLSRKVAYDLNWDNILPKILDAGLVEVVAPAYISILYRIGCHWHIAFHSSGSVNEKELPAMLARVMGERFFSLSGEKIASTEIQTRLYSSGSDKNRSFLPTAQNQWLQLLCPAGKSLGLLMIAPAAGRKYGSGKQEFMGTVANILSMSLNNAQEYHRLRELSVKDNLTGVLNRKGFCECLEKEFQAARRYHKPFSLVMIDLDNFKRVNDNFGHPAGDYFLREFVGCLKNALRQTDIVARCGGDEFVIILTETDRQQAEVLMRRLRIAVVQHPVVFKSQPIDAAFSYGISATEELIAGDTAETLVAKADSRLYQVKRSRKQRYHFAANE